MLNIIVNGKEERERDRERERERERERTFSWETPYKEIKPV